MSIAIKVGNKDVVCRQEYICPDCGHVYRQQKSRRVKCICGGWLTQRTVRRFKKKKEQAA